MAGIGKGSGIKFSAAGIIVTLGIVFGDIGTSPLYVMKAVTREGFAIEVHRNLCIT